MAGTDGRDGLSIETGERTRAVLGCEKVMGACTEPCRECWGDTTRVPAEDAAVDVDAPD